MASSLRSPISFLALGKWLRRWRLRWSIFRWRAVSGRRAVLGGGRYWEEGGTGRRLVTSRRASSSWKCRRLRLVKGESVQRVSTSPCEASSTVSPDFMRNPMSRFRRAEHAPVFERLAAN
jgi:hypothetical protein